MQSVYNEHSKIMDKLRFVAVGVPDYTVELTASSLPWWFSTLCKLITTT
jgi:hypothetical protein